MQRLARAVLSLLAALPDRFLRAGTRLLFSRSWKRFEHATENPRQIQVERLLAIVGRAKDTEFGKAHGFSEIRTLEDYQRRVPIRGFDGFEPYLARIVRGEDNVLTPDRPLFFARSSGTTGTPKHIPVTAMYLAEFRRPRRVWARQVMQAFPGLIRGKFLSIHSPKIEGYTPSGVPYGSITVAYGSKEIAPKGETTPSMFDAVPRAVFLIEDSTDRYYALLRLAAQERVTFAAAVNPSTLVLLAKKLDEHALDLAADLQAGTLRNSAKIPSSIRAEIEPLLRRSPGPAERIRQAKASKGRVIPTDLWPEIGGLLCWKGGSAPFYLAQLDTYYPGRRVMDYGYVATEGGFSIPLSTEGASGVVAVTGHVIELVPERAMSEGRTEPAFLADQLVVGERYRVIITGSHGLYRYDINDVVECTGYHGKTAEIAFVHKGGNMISITGEKIGESHVVEAAAQAQRETAIQLSGFCVSAERGDPPRYVLGVEPEHPLERADLARILSAFERSLCLVNIEYAEKRRSERLGSPKLRLLPHGAFERERDRRVKGGAPDSHVKPPHLIRDPAFLEAMGSELELELGSG